MNKTGRCVFPLSCVHNYNDTIYNRLFHVTKSALRPSLIMFTFMHHLPGVNHMWHLLLPRAASVMRVVLLLPFEVLQMMCRSSHVVLLHEFYIKKKKKTVTGKSLLWWSIKVEETSVAHWADDVGLGDSLVDIAAFPFFFFSFSFATWLVSNVTSWFTRVFCQMPSHCWKLILHFFMLALRMSLECPFWPPHSLFCSAQASSSSSLFTTARWWSMEEVEKVTRVTQDQVIIFIDLWLNVRKWNVC